MKTHQLTEISDKLNIKEAQFGVNDSFTTATTAELMLEFGKTIDEALDIHNDIENKLKVN